MRLVESTSDDDFGSRRDGASSLAAATPLAAPTLPPTAPTVLTLLPPAPGTLAALDAALGATLDAEAALAFAVTSDCCAAALVDVAVAVSDVGGAGGGMKQATTILRSRGRSSIERTRSIVLKTCFKDARAIPLEPSETTRSRTETLRHLVERLGLE